MRRPALLAFTLIALAAPLPAELRECLPRLYAKGCGAAAEQRPPCHQAASACPRGPIRTTVAGMDTDRVSRTSCATKAPAVRFCLTAARMGSCPSAQPRPADSACRLHPTPPGNTSRSPAEPIPAAPLVRLAILVEVEDPHTARAGWVEPVPLRPRAAPLCVAQAPRPPPVSS